MYITTSRKPSANTRILARTISSFISGEYDNRGKKSIESIVSIAQKAGHTRAIIISETKGNPNRLRFISIPEKSLPESQKEGWEWLEPEILFNVSAPDVKRIRTLGKELSFRAADPGDKELLDKLFDPTDPETDELVEIKMTATHLSFRYKDNLLTLKLR